MITIQTEVNGEKLKLEVAPHWTLLHFLRHSLHLTGTRCGCDMGDCGACTVLLNGLSVNACLILAVEADGSTITTIEGLRKEGTLDPIQEAFVEKGAIQCGFCTSGMVMAAKGLLMKNPGPTEEEIRHGLAGNLCRCTGYAKIIEAVAHASYKGT
jgi:carbon-monoxide dehydrogenase small subunit